MLNVTVLAIKTWRVACAGYEGFIALERQSTLGQVQRLEGEVTVTTTDGCEEKPKSTGKLPT
ncbi:hypothetical protein U0070_026793 [Myodes glareolus]|uniref:Uncharacterized protein n=1 Tax=Myodes glareolus TaxID=447135 RepID=A0AAW0I6E8_MYOGA